MAIFEYADFLAVAIPALIIVLLTGYVLSGIVCAVECSRISKMKGYFSPRYWLYGLFLNFIGLLVVNALPKQMQ